MSRENVELVKTLQPAEADLIETFADADAPPVGPSEAELTGFAEDFEVEFVSQVPDAERPSYRGLDGFVTGWRDWLQPWATYRMRVEEYVDAGEKVVALIQVKATTARDGVVVEHAPAAVWTIADGKVVAVRMYLDREDALREAGLSPRGEAVEEPRR